MLRLLGSQSRLCDGLNRREVLCAGGLSALGLGLPLLSRQREAQGAAKATSTPRSCIILFLMGGPPQHSTWDPKPLAPPEVRGEFAPISTCVPGIQYSELLPHSAQIADRLAILRAVSSNDNAHSSSGYYMLTGQPHAPMNFENANPGFPNDSPNLGSIVRKLVTPHGSLPASIRLPHRIFNTDGSVWPGQDAGYLGRANEPWLLNCKPLDVVNQRLDAAESSRAGYGRLADQAFDVLNSAQSRQAFNLELESVETRDRYGRNQFGQSVLLGRRLLEAGVSLVQVNWYRGPEEPSDAPCWDSHAREAQRLRNVLAPPADQALAALILDLEDRGRLDETLVVCMAEFGRTPRLNGAAG